MTDPTTVPHGCLPAGATTPLGVIDAVSSTAYRIGGAWVPFMRVHGAYAPAMPLVVVR